MIPNTKLFFMVVTVTAAVAVAVVGPLTITAPAIAQNVTGDNATMMSADNKTAAIGPSRKFLILCNRSL